MSDFLSRNIPQASVPATLVNPRTLVIYTDLKAGKSTISAWLSRNRRAVWADTENGSGGMPGRAVNIVERAAVEKLNKVDFYQRLCAELAAEQPAICDYFVTDKVDQLETWAEGWATADYKRTVLGKDFKGSSISEVPYVGWSLWHEKFLALWNAAKSAAPYAIFFGSLKQGGSDKFGKHDAAKAGLACSFDLDLGTRQRKTAVGDSDATALMWREPDGSNWLSFASREQGAFTGCRVPRLEGSRFRFSWIKSYGCCQAEWAPGDYPRHLADKHQGTKPADLQVNIEVAWNQLYVEDEKGVPK